MGVDCCAEDRKDQSQWLNERSTLNLTRFSDIQTLKPEKKQLSKTQSTSHLVPGELPGEDKKTAVTSQSLSLA